MLSKNKCARYEMIPGRNHFMKGCFTFQWWWGGGGLDGGFIFKLGVPHGEKRGALVLMGGRGFEKNCSGVPPAPPTMENPELCR